jgi:4'-phosphopantetheinyl transferase
MKIGVNEVHLWLTICHAEWDTRLLERYRGVMNDDERRQARRFVHAADTHRYVTTRALARTVLARYLDTDASTLQFETSEFGRPFVRGIAPEALSFNLSHTRELVVCVVARGGSVGVDTESLLQAPAPLEVASEYFAPPEVRAIRHLPSELRHRRFYETWTLKEAYIKAVGKGLAIPLDAFHFNLGGSGKVLPSFSSRLCESPSKCHFWMLSGPSDHLISICMRGPEDAPQLTKQVRIVPLRSEYPWECSVLRTSADLDIMVAR